MLTNQNKVRELTKLLSESSIDDKLISSFIRRAESKVLLVLKQKYLVPLQENIQRLGTVSGLKDTTTVTGIDTEFTKLSIGDYIRIDSTGEVLVISDIVSDTELTVEEYTYNNVDYLNIYKDFSNSTYFVIPSEISTAVEYLTAKLILEMHFSEQAFNQETQTFKNNYENFANSIVKQLNNGNYINLDLKQQIENYSQDRKVIAVSDSYDSYLKENISNW